MNAAFNVLTDQSLFPDSICVSLNHQLSPSRRLSRKRVSRIYDEYAAEHEDFEEELEDLSDLIMEEEDNL